MRSIDLTVFNTHNTMTESIYFILCKNFFIFHIKMHGVFACAAFNALTLF